MKYLTKLDMLPRLTILTRLHKAIRLSFFNLPEEMVM